VSNSGVRIHIQHLIFERDLDEYKSERNLYRVSDKEYMDHIITPKLDEIFEVLWDHFSLSATSAEGHRDQCQVIPLMKININSRASIFQPPAISMVPIVNARVSLEIEGDNDAGAEAGSSALLRPARTHSVPIISDAEDTDEDELEDLLSAEAPQ